MDVSLRLMVEGFKMLDTVTERTAEERRKRAEIAAQADSGDEEYKTNEKEVGSEPSAKVLTSEE
jgi:hypothetical protein